MKKTKLLLIIVLAFGAGPAMASPVQAIYRGIIDYAETPGLDGSVVIGGTFSGTYTFESTKESAGYPTFGRYLYDEEAPVGMTMTVTVGNYTFETENHNPSSVTSLIHVKNDDEEWGDPEDAYELATFEIVQTAGPIIAGLEPAEIAIRLRTEVNLSTFTSVDLPLTEPDLANFEHNSFYLSLGNEHILVEGHLTELAILGPTIFYVDDSASGPIENGTSWDYAFNHLQDALSLARAGNRICVAQGIYKPDQGGEATPGDRFSTFWLKNFVLIQGGYAGFGEPDPDARDIVTYETILTGDLNRDDIGFTNNDENSYHVVTAIEMGTSAVLDGFTITGGNANGSYPDNQGAGMFNASRFPTVQNCRFTGNVADVGAGMYNEMCNTTIVNCRFSNNHATVTGGGIFNFFSNPELTDCTFSANSAALGGGMYNESSSPNVYNCDFYNNSAWGSIEIFGGYFGGGGGAMCNRESSPTVVFCIFRENSAIPLEGWGAGSGGAMSNWVSSSPSVINCSFIGNWAEGEGEHSGGGAMSNDFYCAPEIRNCTFTNNSATNNGGALYGSDEAINVYNSILWGNEAGNGPEIALANNCSVSVNYCDLQGEFSGISAESGCTVELNHTIYDDPLFQDADGRLSWNSPCIDTGDDTTVSSFHDLDGHLRIMDGNNDGIVDVDMGAYEYVYLWGWDIDGDGIENLIDLEPEFASNDFADTFTPVTYGHIVTRGDQTLTVTDWPGVGIQVQAAPNPDGGSGLAQVDFCDGRFIVELGSADMATRGCDSEIEVFEGTVTITYSAYDGAVAVITLAENNSLEFGLDTFSITAAVDNVDFVVVEVDGKVYALAPGETKTFATIDIDPDKLNLTSQGKWITCYIELSEGLDVADIDVSTVELNGVQALSHPTEIGDYDLDGVVDLMVKFDKAVVQETLEVGDKVLIIVTGELSDGIVFEGNDTIRVID